MKDIADKVFANTMSCFIWTSDHIIHPDYFDHWESHIDEVELGQTFRDDCDGCALTNAEGLYRQDIPKGLIRIIFCETETKEKHLVAGYKHWILDNRQRRLMYWKDIPYRWISSMRLNEPRVWRSTI
jgi:predicted transglutaminase-like cysteine proteinase